MSYRFLRVTCACLLAAAFLVLAPQHPVHAIPVTFEFSGRITSVLDGDNLLGGAVSEGDLFTGRFSYDTDTPDSDASPSVGAYWHDQGPYGLSVAIGGLPFGSDPDATTFLAAVFDGSSEDRVSLTSFANLMPGVNDGLSLILLELVDPAGEALSSTQLPLSYTLDTWSSAWSRLTLGNGDCVSEYTLHGTIERIDSVPIDAIPEPGSMVLIGSGLLGMFARRRLAGMHGAVDLISEK